MGEPIWASVVHGSIAAKTPTNSTRNWIDMPQPPRLRCVSTAIDIPMESRCPSSKSFNRHAPGKSVRIPNQETRQVCHAQLKLPDLFSCACALTKSLPTRQAREAARAEVFLSLPISPANRLLARRRFDRIPNRASASVALVVAWANQCCSWRGDGNDQLWTTGHSGFRTWGRSDTIDS